MISSRNVISLEEGRRAVSAKKQYRKSSTRPPFAGLAPGDQKLKLKLVDRLQLIRVLQMGPDGKLEISPVLHTLIATYNNS